MVAVFPSVSRWWLRTVLGLDGAPEAAIRIIDAVSDGLLLLLDVGGVGCPLAGVLLLCGAQARLLTSLAPAFAAALCCRSSAESRELRADPQWQSPLPSGEGGGSGSCSSRCRRSGASLRSTWGPRRMASVGTCHTRSGAPRARELPRLCFPAAGPAFTSAGNERSLCSAMRALCSRRRTMSPSPIATSLRTSCTRQAPHGPGVGTGGRRWAWWSRPLQWRPDAGLSE